MQDEVNQEESEQNKVDGIGINSTGNVVHAEKERLMICNKDDADALARKTTDEERVLHGDSTEIRLCR